MNNYRVALGRRGNFDETGVIEWIEVNADSQKEAETAAFACLSDRHALDEEELKQWEVVVLNKQETRVS